MKKSKNKKILKRNIPLIIMILPTLIYMIIFHYLPMGGVIIAFKDFKYPRGIFGSDWNGLDNLETFFKSNDAVVVIGNTLFYSLVMLFLSIICSFLVALFLYEVTNKFLIKTYQTSILIPNFVSWVLVSYIVFALLSHEHGVLNQIIEKFGGEAISWYNTPLYWKFILPLVNLWKVCGQKSLLYYAALMGVDPSLYEAADIDGASRWTKMTKITLPSIAPVVATVLILGMGSVLNDNFDLFYQVPRQSSALFSTTDVIGTYVYRLLMNGGVGVGAAIGLFQSIVGAVLLVVVNLIVRKVDPDSSLF